MVKLFLILFVNSKYNMAGFSEEVKQKQYVMQFPKDLEKAFEIGADLSK